MNPEEDEHHVAALLRGEGWMARVTSYSRDHGLDIIAERQGRRVGVQVKMYGAPVELWVKRALRVPKRPRESALGALGGRLDVAQLSGRRAGRLTDPPGASRARASRKGSPAKRPFLGRCAVSRRSRRRPSRRLQVADFTPKRR